MHVVARSGVYLETEETCAAAPLAYNIMTICQKFLYKLQFWHASWESVLLVQIMFEHFRKCSAIRRRWRLGFSSVHICTCALVVHGCCRWFGGFLRSSPLRNRIPPRRSPAAGQEASNSHTAADAVDGR